MKGYLRTHVKFWKPVIPPDVVSLLVGERKEVWNVKVDGRAKETLPVASFSMSGNSPKYEEKIFPFYVAFEIYIYIFKLYKII